MTDASGRALEKGFALVAKAVEAKCRANTERPAWRHRVDGRVKPGQGDLGEWFPLHATIFNRARHKNESFLVLFCKKELLP
jgi:hypothetical protein